MHLTLYRLQAIVFIRLSCNKMYLATLCHALPLKFAYFSLQSLSLEYAGIFRFSFHSHKDHLTHFSARM